MWQDTFRIALEAVRTNRSRATLTVLSVVIGVGSIVFSVSAGESLAHFIKTQLASLGTDLMWLSPASRSAQPDRRHEPLTWEDARAVGELAGVLQVGPRASRQTVMSLGERHVRGEILAVNGNYFDMRNKRLLLGRAFIPSDLELRRPVCVVAPGIVERLLYRTPEPLGQVLKLDGRPFVVIGVLAGSGTTIKTPGLEENNAVFVPVTTAARVFAMRELDFIFFQPRPSFSRQALRQQIRQLLLVRKGPRSAYEIDSLDERMAQIENLIWVAIVVFGSIAGVSLIVAGIGIMNIMLLAVMERTREIGIRKAVGARKADILAQFFTESILLSACGGLLGVLAGGAGTTTLALLTSGVISISWTAAAVAFFFALTVGVFFGLFPAVRAAQLKPINALAREVG